MNGSRLLSFLRGNGRLFRGTEIEHNIEAAFGKLDAFVPDGLAKSLEKVKTLFVRTTDYGHIHVLAVERILTISMEEVQFDYPENFDPEALLDDAFSIVYDEPIEAKILFSPEVARYIKERVWAKGQKITDCEDGSVMLEMTTSGWIDMKRWVMSFGADAVVVEPGELREEVREELGKALERYSTCL